jgi:hypothetical protein
MDLPCGVVPVKREAKVSRAFPINIDLIFLLEYAGKMFDIFLVDVLHSKVVDNKGEADWVPVMTPISWCDLALPVPCLVEALGEEVLSNNSGLREAVHPASHFAEDVAICICFVMESILIDDVLREQFQFHSEVLITFHGSHEVAEVLDVDSHELCIGGGDDAVEHEFDGEEVCGWCTTVIGVLTRLPSIMIRVRYGSFFSKW